MLLAVGVVLDADQVVAEPVEQSRRLEQARRVARVGYEEVAEFELVAVVHVLGLAVSRGDRRGEPPDSNLARRAPPFAPARGRSSRAGLLRVTSAAKQMATLTPVRGVTELVSRRSERDVLDGLLEAVHGGQSQSRAKGREYLKGISARTIDRDAPPDLAS